MAETIFDKWVRQGKPQDKHGVPHEVKCFIVQDYGERFNLDVFVETGTCHGAMVKANVDNFPEIHTIEMYEPNYEIAKQNLAQWNHVGVYSGDSSEILSEIVSRLECPALFFLDAHYSGDGTARGAVDTPIVKELEILAASPYPNVVIIDDARLFSDERYHTEDFKDYPSFEWIKSFVKDNFIVPSIVEREADEFIITPKGLE